MSNVKLRLPNYQLIHCLDPGGTTGYARIRIYYNKGEVAKIEIERVTEFPLFRDIEKLITENSDEEQCIVYESFKLWTMAANLLPVEIIGVIKFLSGKYKITNYHQEPAIQGKQTFKATGNRKQDTTPIVNCWYPELKRFSSHHSSALRHGVYFVVTRLANNKRVPIIFNYNKLMG